MLFAEALNADAGAVRCLGEGVLRSAPDANTGSLPARELAELYGERFVPPASLVTMAGKGARYE